MQNDSPLSNLDIDSIEELYQQYLKNPESVDKSWNNFFQGFDYTAFHFCRIGPRISYHDIRHGYTDLGFLFPWNHERTVNSNNHQGSHQQHRKLGVDEKIGNFINDYCFNN